MGEDIRKHIIFSGRVQGVGFRYRSYDIAQRLGVTGWVKNLYDGTVEMEIQGKEEEIDRLILSLGEDHYINITNMDVKSKPLKKKEEKFSILN